MAGSKTHRRAFTLVVVSFLLSTCVSLASLHFTNKRNVREMNRILATQVYDHIVGELSEPITVARTMANSSNLYETLAQDATADQAATEEKLAGFLLGIENGLGYQSAFAIADSTHRYYTSGGFTRIVDPSTDHDAWYSSLMAKSEDYDLDVDNDEVDAKDLTVYVNAKVMGPDERPVGICGLGVRMTGIQSLFYLLEQDFNVKISLVDPNGLVQVDTNEANIEHASLRNLVNGNEVDDYKYTELEHGRFAVTKYIPALDWYLVVQSTGTGEAGQFASVIVLNFVLCLVVLAIMVMALRYSRKRTEELAKASMVDHLTMLLNRHAFENDKEALLNGTPNDDLVCVMADVNGLKTVNDTLGHEAGDELIRGAGECLQKCFAKYGRVYRTGGDEFSALLYMTGKEQIHLEEELTQVVDAWSGDKVGSLSISCGYAARREFPGESVYELFRIADKRMYEAKADHYERTGIERRRT